MILISCQEVDLIELLKSHFQGMKGQVFSIQFNSLFLRYRIQILHNYIHIHDIGHERTCTSLI